MMVDTTVYGWLNDGGVTCARCTGLDHWNGRLDGILAEGVRPIYSLDDDGRGLSCDDCGEYVFEPDDSYCGDCDDFDCDCKDDEDDEDDTPAEA